jgi:hypothetical protein
METQAHQDFFEDGDLTALVCVEEAMLQSIVVEQLRELGYKLHNGLFGEDVQLKLRTHPYDVIVVDENFGGLDLESNPVLTEINEIPLAQRRKQFVVLIGPGMVTNNYMQAFTHSADLVCSFSDLPNLRVVLRRGAMAHKQFYARLIECLQTAGMA